MDGLRYERDIRNSDPDQTGHRRSRFLEGWKKAADGATFQDATLRDLT